MRRGRCAQSAPTHGLLNGWCKRLTLEGLLRLKEGFDERDLATAAYDDERATELRPVVRALRRLDASLNRPPQDPPGAG